MEIFNDGHPDVHTKYEGIKDKCILISGGTTGIGRATARLLGSYGARIFVYGRHEPELDEALAEINETGAEVGGMVADQADLEDVKAVFEEIDKRWGRLDIIINNAALGAEGIGDMENEDWKYIVDSNLCGYMACTKEALKRMEKQKSGHIVFIGSMSADEREAGSSVYVATKAGIQGFTEALRKEANEKGIKVSLIEPGAVGTDMQTSVPPDEQRKKEKEGTMLKAEDIAVAVHYVLTQPQRCDVVMLQIRPHLQII
jgi:NADP-dependent 3-hydroxy acid dehydrogenase YdfG